MKKPFIFLSLLFLCFSMSLSAQVSVYQKKGVIDDLKGRTTFFVIPVWDTVVKADYIKAISQVWTLTPFQVGTPAEAARLYARNNWAFFTIGHEFEGASNNKHFYGVYEFWLSPLDGKDEEDKKLIAAALLGYDQDVARMLETTASPGPFNSRRKEHVHETNSKLATIHYFGWGPGLLKGYIKRVNDLVMDEEKWDRERNNYINDTAVDALHKDTLYIPEYMMQTIGGASLSFKSRDVDISELKEYYDFPVRFISDDSLKLLTSNPEKPVYFLTMATDLNFSNRILTVYEAKSGATIWIKHFFGGPVRFYQSDLTWIGKRAKDRQ